MTGSGGKQVGQRAGRCTLEKILLTRLDLKPMEAHGKNPLELWWASDQGSVQKQRESNRKSHIYSMDWQFYQPSPWQGELKEKGGGEKIKMKRRKRRTTKPKTTGGQGESRGMVIYIFISKILIRSLLTHLADYNKTAWGARNKCYSSPIRGPSHFSGELFQLFLTIWPFSCLEDLLSASKAVRFAELMCSISYRRVFQWCANRSRKKVNQ